MQNCLPELYQLLTDYMTKRLKSGDVLPPGELATIRQFLKDNGLDAHQNTAEPYTWSDLPDFGEDDEQSG